MNNSTQCEKWHDIVIAVRSGNNCCVIVTVQAMIAEEEKKGIDRSRIVIGGFSQGGAVALYSAFTVPQKPVAGIVGLSTWLPMHKTFPAVCNATLSSTYRSMATVKLT